MWILLFSIFYPTVAADYLSFSPQIITHKNTDWLAISYKNDPGWHTYWKNPGDAGLPLSWNFYIGEKEISLSSLEWPSPKRFFEGKGLITFGYEGEYSFFFPLRKNIAKEAKRGNLRVKSRYLICKDVCIPGKGEAFAGGGSFRLSRDKLIERMEKRPRHRPFPDELAMELVVEQGEELAFYYKLNHRVSLDKPLLIPFPHPLLGFKKEHLVGNTFGRYTVDWEGEYADEPIPLPEYFTPPLRVRFLYFNPNSKKTEVIRRSISSFGSEKLKKTFSLLSNKKKASRKSSWTVYILAFLGGVILNFMPCVLPVVMLKLFSLIKNKEIDRKTVFKNNMLYTGGILFSFLILAVIVIMIKSGGEQIGWGFQLQSPGFVAFIITSLFLFSLNLFGLFEFKIPWGSSIGGMSTKGHPLEYFFNGILSTVLATPCSAPFLGTALTFAFTGSSLNIILIFLSIGLGLSSPFIIECIFPKMISFCLPRPGVWMDHAKKFLGLVLLFVIIWLLDVFISQVESDVVTFLLLGLTLLFFSVYGCFRMFSSFLSKTALVTLSLLCLFTMWYSLESSGKKLWHPWRPSSLEQHQKEGRWVFMNFTAKWCLTCKMNTPLFESKKFARLMEKYNVIPLKADWTKRDPVIGRWLEEQGVVGIPAYFIRSPKGEMISLGETISLEEIESHFKN